MRNLGKVNGKFRFKSDFNLHILNNLFQRANEKFSPAHLIPSELNNKKMNKINRAWPPAWMTTFSDELKAAR
jgi:hypothetical protein